MRIAMIDPSLFTPSYDQALACALVEVGHEVTLYGRRPGPSDANPPGVPLADIFYRVADSRAAHTLPRQARLALKGVDHLWSMGRLLRRLRRSPPDVIHFQWVALPMVDRRMLAAFRRLGPLILTMHDTNPFNGNPSSRLQALGMAGCIAQFDKVIVHTVQGRDRLAALGVDADRLAIVPHGPVWPALPPPPADPMEGVMTFTLFGKIKPYKGADILIEAFARLPAALRLQSRVRIVGKSYMDLAPLHALAQTLGVASQVEIEDRFVADDEITGLFGPGVIAAFPYREIDSSGVLPQALAQGRPVIAFAIGGFAETLIDGRHGHLVAAGDGAGFTAGMEHLVADRGFAAACAGHARALSDQGVTWDAIARQTAALYRLAGAGSDAAAPAPAHARSAALAG